ncbi:hypothetical protein IWZ01DRAFT_271790 [Phyllosticta capitalensis]
MGDGRKGVSMTASPSLSPCGLLILFPLFLFLQFISCMIATKWQKATWLYNFCPIELSLPMGAVAVWAKSRWVDGKLTGVGPLQRNDRRGCKGHLGQCTLDLICACSCGTPCLEHSRASVEASVVN